MASIVPPLNHRFCILPAFGPGSRPQGPGIQRSRDIPTPPAAGLRAAPRRRGRVGRSGPHPGLGARRPGSGERDTPRREGSGPPPRPTVACTARNSALGRCKMGFSHTPTASMATGAAPAAVGQPPSTSRSSRSVPSERISVVPGMNTVATMRALCMSQLAPCVTTISIVPSVTPPFFVPANSRHGPATNLGHLWVRLSVVPPVSPTNSRPVHAGPCRPRLLLGTSWGLRTWLTGLHFLLSPRHTRFLLQTSDVRRQPSAVRTIALGRSWEAPVGQPIPQSGR